MRCLITIALFAGAAVSCADPDPLFGDYYLPSEGPIGIARQAVTTGDGPGGAHILFLNFDGAMLSAPAAFRDNSAKNESQLVRNGPVSYPAFNGTPYGPALTRQAAIDQVTNQFRSYFGAYNVMVVYNRPASGRYTMCMIGGTPAVLGLPGGAAAGVAPLDCGNANEPDVVYAFSDRLTPQLTGGATYSLKAIATTCAQEVAHAFGLGHTQNPKDIMYPQLTPQVVGFGGKAMLANDGSGRCSGPGATEQDSHAMLLDVLGAGNGGPIPDGGTATDGAVTPGEAPKVAFAAPKEGSTVPRTFEIRVAAKASAGRSISKIEVGTAGQILFTMTSPPYTRSVTAPTDGTFQIEATATDDAGSSASASVGFTVKDGAPPPGGCASDTDCNTGLSCIAGECQFPSDGSSCAMPCPAGTTCQKDGSCAPAGNTPADAGSGCVNCGRGSSGGCDAARRGGATPLALLVCLAALLLAQRWRST